MPLLWKPGHRPPSSTPQAVEALARSNQRKIARDPEIAEFCRSYMQKLNNQRLIQVLGTIDELTPEQRGWYIPCHVVNSSGNYKLVFNCSFEFAGQNLNGELLAGPTLSPSLLEVLLRFC